MLGPSVSVHNGAVPGTGSAYMASCLSLHVPRAADVVFVDYSINDKRREELPVGTAPMDNPTRRPFERLLRKLLNYPRWVAARVIQVAEQSLWTEARLHRVGAQQYSEGQPL